ncbi:MAG TPA: peptide chain release factor N(5)-glutamine methyltransferase [Bacteroidales bacterium]|nr:peptide chain release factor N(5)-glutamine methyltransferase [Bacteroidales bacterium]
MKVASNKISDIKSFIRNRLHGLYPDEEINAFIYMLFEAYCGLSKTALLAMKRETINESELLLVYDAVNELEHYKPIQYILGKTEFYGLEFRVTLAVLIPRPETEELVDLIIKENKNKTGLKILDIGTGSGCIAISLKTYLPGAEVTAIDISEEALALAKKNAEINQEEIVFKKIDILEEQQWPNIKGFDVIVSNPPYVLESEKAMMQPNVLDFEPPTALFVPDANALLFYEAIFAMAVRQNKKTKIYAEINESKAAELSRMAQQYGIVESVVVKDINNKDRFFVGEVNP